jgi:hypothetical protein
LCLTRCSKENGFRREANPLNRVSLVEIRVAEEMQQPA